ncbi:MAG: hypothetical protein ACYS3N_21830 [Planctomycetota bacterium]|jgi:hypothetical protein
MIEKGKVIDIMQDGKKAMFKFLCFTMACSLIGLFGCRKSSDRLEGEPLSEVLLRYTPQVGQINDYKFIMNLDKKLFYRGKWRNEGNEKLEGIFSIKTIEQNGDNYRTKCDMRMGNSNISKETMDVMRDKAKAVRSIDLNISDRYVYDKAGTENLCFPDEPISPGSKWEGEIIFIFGDMATVNEPTLKMSYQLIKAVENKDGRYCVIECKPITDQVEVPLQLGQLGLKCDATGKVTAVRQDSDAQGKIKIGDVLVAVNGQKTVTAKDWHVIYERFIEMPNNIGSAVLLTISRDGREQDVKVKKSFVTLGTMGIKISKGTRKVVFDIDKGIIISDETSPVYSVMYHCFDEFPFVDDYMGTNSFERSAGTKIGPRIYRNQWKMKLLQ